MIDILILFLKPMLYFVYYGKQLSKMPKTMDNLFPALKLVVCLIVLFIPTLLGVIADITMNNTTVPMALGGGRFEEFTFSTRLERLCVKDDNELITKDLCIQIALAINRVCPTKDHIVAVIPLQEAMASAKLAAAVTAA